MHEYDFQQDEVSTPVDYGMIPGQATVVKKADEIQDFWELGLPFKFFGPLFS